MRHGKKFNHLSRTSAHRKAMLANMACSLIEYKRIKTTLAKAKALRVYIEPLITKSKDDTTHSRRIVFSYLKQKEAITELFGDIATKVADRPGGYTRILKLSNRLGDNAQMACIELVDYNEVYTTDKPKRKKVRRAKKKTIESVSPVVEEAVVVEETKEELTSEEVTTEDALVEETKEKPTSEEVITEDASVEETKEEPTSEELTTEDTSVEETKEESTSEEVITEDASVEENKEEPNANNKEEKGK